MTCLFALSPSLARTINMRPNARGSLTPKLTALKQKWQMEFNTVWLETLRVALPFHGSTVSASILTRVTVCMEFYMFSLGSCRIP